MKIAVLMNINSPWSHMICKELRDQGVDVEIFYPASKEQVSYINNNSTEIIKFEKIFKVHCLETPNIGLADYLFAGLELKKILKKRKFDLLLCLYGGGLAAIAYFSGFRPYAVYLVGSDVHYSSGLGTIIARTIYKSAVKVFANGNDLAKLARQKFRRDDIEVFYHGIEVDKFSSDKEKGVSIICTRGFLPVYNNQYLFEALRYVDADKIEKIIFSAGGQELKLCKSLANKILPATLNKKLEFLSGVTHDTIRELLSKSKIFISLSFSDGTSTSLLEAMASGVFPILSDIPANRPWVNRRRLNGILIPFNQPKKLAQSIDLAIKDVQWRSKAIKINRKIVEENFDISTNIKKMIEIVTQSVSDAQQPKN